MNELNCTTKRTLTHTLSNAFLKDLCTRAYIYIPPPCTSNKYRKINTNGIYTLRIDTYEESSQKRDVCLITRGLWSCGYRKKKKKPGKTEREGREGSLLNLDCYPGIPRYFFRGVYPTVLGGIRGYPLVP